MKNVTALHQKNSKLQFIYESNFLANTSHQKDALFQTDTSIGHLYYQIPDMTLEYINQFRNLHCDIVPRLIKLSYDKLI